MMPKTTPSFVFSAWLPRTPPPCRPRKTIFKSDWIKHVKSALIKNLSMSEASLVFIDGFPNADKPKRTGIIPCFIQQILLWPESIVMLSQANIFLFLISLPPHVSGSY